jgi:phosphoribosylaminoimidazole (AIR) synthetase
VPKNDAEKIKRELQRYGEKVFRIGEIVSGEKGVKLVGLSEVRR